MQVSRSSETSQRHLCQDPWGHHGSGWLPCRRPAPGVDQDVHRHQLVAGVCDDEPAFEL